MAVRHIALGNNVSSFSVLAAPVTKNVQVSSRKKPNIQKYNLYETRPVSLPPPPRRRMRTTRWSAPGATAPSRRSTPTWTWWS